jgi:hypothetical protein
MLWRRAFIGWSTPCRVGLVAKAEQEVDQLVDLLSDLGRGHVSRVT